MNAESAVFVVETWHEASDGEVSAPVDYYCRTLKAAVALAGKLSATTGLRVGITEHPFGDDGVATDPVPHGWQSSRNGSR